MRDHGRRPSSPGARAGSLPVRQRTPVAVRHHDTMSSEGPGRDAAGVHAQASLLDPGRPHVSPDHGLPVGRGGMREACALVRAERATQGVFAPDLSATSGLGRASASDAPRRAGGRSVPATSRAGKDNEAEVMGGSNLLTLSQVTGARRNSTQLASNHGAGKAAKRGSSADIRNRFRCPACCCRSCAGPSMRELLHFAVRLGLGAVRP